MLMQLPIKGRYFIDSYHSKSNKTGGRVAVIFHTFLLGWQNETFDKELCVNSAAASQMFLFQAPYKIAEHGREDNGINWIDVHIECSELHAVVNEAVAVFAHL